MSKKLYINTIGCQMNVYDSEQIEIALKRLGYTTTRSIESADLIIVNTCAIREKAEQKAFSFLGRLTRLKNKNHRLIVGVGGCVAQQYGRKILKRMPHVDLIFGPNALMRLPAAIRKIENQRCRIVDVNLNEIIEEGKPQSIKKHEASVSKFVTIMRGCDNFCAYCVVPHVRGRETSRNPDLIVTEVESLVGAGVREVTLLGQNVNSYGKKEGLCSFSELLSRANAIDGLSRIRFTTSHPKDLSDDLIQAFSQLEKLCSHIHLPVQSGSDRILKRMNRKYTRSEYLGKVADLRRSCPDISITSDIIVGFPGETEADFEATLDLIRGMQYDSLFVFNYSDRPSAPSRKFPDKVDDREKAQRLQHVLDLQASISAKINRQMVGRQEPVLVEGLSKRQQNDDHVSSGQDMQWSGRTRCNKIVNFAVDETISTDSIDIVGKTLDVRIERALSHSLWGKCVERGVPRSGMKGENSYAA